MDRRHSRRTKRIVAAGVVALWFAASAAPAFADDYDPDQAGHPLRVVAYIFHPVGVALDYLIFRPAHWIGSHEPVRTIFGHEDEG